VKIRFIKNLYFHDTLYKKKLEAPGSRYEEFAMSEELSDEELDERRKTRYTILGASAP
jgi:hypothetical protein